ncbi:MAG: M3 family oligoendopeptidase, partial [Bacteroidota bacterium]
MEITQTATFAELRYERPVMETVAKAMEQALEQFASAQDLTTVQEAMDTIYGIRADFDRAYNIAYVRHSCDTRDAFYEAENAFFDEQLPVFAQYKSQFYQALLDTPFREELVNVHGRQLFAIAELSLRTFRPEIIEDLQEENRLASAYTKLKAGAQIDLRGETY